MKVDWEKRDAAMARLHERKRKERLERTWAEPPNMGNCSGRVAKELDYVKTRKLDRTKARDMVQEERRRLSIDPTVNKEEPNLKRCHCKAAKELDYLLHISKKKKVDSGSVRKILKEKDRIEGIIEDMTPLDRKSQYDCKDWD